MTGYGVIEQKRVLVRGKVRGVGFRYYARAVAASMNLRGTVRNLPDGQTLEAVVQGERSLVKQFVIAMKRGPSEAVVDSVEAIPEKVDPKLSLFYIMK